MEELRRLSKFLSLILRHSAGQFRLRLDEEGFAYLEQVWSLVERRFPPLYSPSDLQTVVEGKVDGKKRFEVRAGRICAPCTDTAPFLQ